MNNPINHGQTQQGSLNNSGNQSQMNHPNINQMYGSMFQVTEVVLYDDNHNFVQVTNPVNAN